MHCYTNADNLASIFHHCNLDRLAAIWESIHYNATIQEVAYMSNGLFSTAKGEVITADSPLKPFYQADGQTFHTGRSIVNISDFGYTYPELQDVDLDVYQNSLRVIEIVNNLYGIPIPPGVEQPHPKDFHTTVDTTRDWIVNVEVERSELELPCTINLYVGDRYAGRTTLLNMPMHGVLSDEIPLTHVIDASRFRGMSPDAIEDQLERDLYFEIRKVCYLPYFH